MVILEYFKLGWKYQLNCVTLYIYQKKYICQTFLHEILSIFVFLYGDESAKSSLS